MKYIIILCLLFNISYANYYSVKLMNINKDCSFDIMYGNIFTNQYNCIYTKVKLDYIEITDEITAYKLLKELIDTKRITVTKLKYINNEIYCCIIYNNIDISNYLLDKSVAKRK